MTQNTDGRVELIKKLLAKANAAGTTPQEREAFSDKANQLMLQWGIEEALLSAESNRLATEKIIMKMFTTEAPATYSYEVTGVGIEVARALGCKGLLSKVSNSKTDLLVVGFESDVDRVNQLFQALTRQVQLDLAYTITNFSEFHHRAWSSLSGTSKFNFRRSFIAGFALGIREKMRSWKKDITEATGPGTELVLVDRTKRIQDWMDQNMQVGSGHARRYMPSGHSLGRAAGMRADVGGGKIGGGRGQIGGVR